MDEIEDIANDALLTIQGRFKDRTTVCIIVRNLERPDADLFIGDATREHVEQVLENLKV